MSGIGTGTALMIGGLAGAGGSLASGFMGSSAAGNAADAQANAANHAADLQYDASNKALAFQEKQYNQGQSNLAPWLQSGAGALGNLDYLLGISPPTTQGGMAGGPLTPYGGGGSTGATGGFGSNQPIGMRPNAGLTARGGPIAGIGDGNQPIGLRPTTGVNGTSNARAVAGGPFTMNPGGNFGSLDQPMGRATGGPISSPTGPQSYTSMGGYAHPGASGPAQFGSTGGGVGAPGTTGTTNLGSTVNPGLGGFGSLMADNPYSTFTAPTGLTMQNDPGYQARLDLGMDAMDRSAAARGSVLTGGTVQAENQAAQDYASNEYGNVYNRAFNTNASNYNSYAQNQTNKYNRLASLAGVGQQTAGQLGMLGNEASQGISSNLLNTAGQMGQDYQNAGAANASGYYNSAAAIGGGINGAAGNLSQLMMMQKMFGGGGGNPYQTLYNAQNPNTAYAGLTDTGAGIYLS